ncbi:DNA mismatch repair protein MSH4 [Citrus sinensis]|nr:DNA mismatch repair protein MSH4 [Citrus sinensis]
MEDDAGEQSSFVTGLIQNRAKEVGVAAFDLRSAALHLSQYIETSSSYQNTKTLLHFYDPTAIIVSPNKLAPDGMVGVSELIDRFYPSVRKVVMARGCFDDTKGAVMIKNLAAKEPSALSLDTYYKQYYLCLAAAAAIIKWIEAEKGVIVTNHSLSVTFNGSFDHMNIDATSVRNLEIIEPLHSALWGTSNKKRSLFHMLKTTKTIGGTRLLRANLLQPLKDIETINTRLDCLTKTTGIMVLIAQVEFLNQLDDELMSNEQLFFGLSQFLRKFPKETDRVLCHFCFKPKKVTSKVLDVDNAKKSQTLISSIILLKTALDALPLLAKVLKDAQSFLLANIYRSVCENEKYASIRKRIGEVIDEDVLHARVPFVARTQQCFAIKAGIDGLLDIARRSFCDTSEGRETWKQHTLLNFGTRFPLVDAIREDVSVLTLLAEVLCLLDMIVNSFAHTISTKPVDRYTRPHFTENGPLAIDGGRHPILESIHNDFIPNNIFISEAANMVIVTGPNMSGKSTYLQQVCLIVILAQIGCYVPAHFSTIRVVDRIFTRMGTVDNLESNSSTFMTEMKETAFVMQNVSERSLIVMDELGRATSSSDGFAIAWSCCEHLLSLKAYTIFASHMENLSELATIYPNVKVLHFYVVIRNNRLDFKFQLKDGPRHVPHYGLLLAEVAGLPSTVIETARSITSRITEKNIQNMECRNLVVPAIELIKSERKLHRRKDLKFLTKTKQLLDHLPSFPEKDGNGRGLAAKHFSLGIKHDFCHSEVQRNSQRITCRIRNESNLENAIPGTAAEKIGCARGQAHN